MITRNDCLLLLDEIQSSGVDTKMQLTKLLKSPEVDISVLKFINDNRQLDLSRFYDKIRKSYNNKRSSLYINIVKEIDNPQEVITTLSAMLTQIFLFVKNADDKKMFLKHSRANEITVVLNKYLKDSDLTNCLKLLRLIKSDIKALESIRKS